MKLKEFVLNVAFMAVLLPAFVWAHEPAVEWAAKHAGNYSKAFSAIDSSGNTYVASSHDGVYTTVKHDANGAELWAKEYVSGNWDSVMGIAVDSSGNAYITGSGHAGLYFDYITIKYDTHGNEIWVRRYDGGRYDMPHAITVDSTGNVYVTGASDQGRPGDWTSPLAYVTVKYDTNGNLLWDVSYYYGSQDVPEDITVDASGHVYVTGRSWGGGQWGCNEAHNDYATVKYDASGHQLWAKRYNGPGGCGNGWGNYNDLAHDLAVDAAGNVYVTGESYHDGITDYATIKYDAGGNELWVKRYDRGVARSVAVDMAGNVYVTGRWFDIRGYATIKYDASGNELWLRTFSSGESEPFSVKLDTFTNVYVTGNDYTAGKDFFTIKYDTSGTELWAKRYDSCGEDHLPSLAMDSHNNVYVTGSILGQALVTVKYNQIDPGAPSAPRDLTATVFSSSRIDLSWTDNSTEDGFKVLRSTSATGYYGVVAALQSNSTSYHDTDLSADTSYYYKVVAFNAAGASDYANLAGSSGCGAAYVASATTLPLPPDAVAPVITYAVDPVPNANGWNNTDVTVSFTCSDPMPGSGIASCPAPVTVTTEGAGQVIAGTAIDNAGNTASASVTLNIDKTPPSIIINNPQQTIWPPTSKTVNVNLSGSISDLLPGVISASYVVHDEYDIVNPSGAVTLTPEGSFDFTVSLVASRLATDMDGRTYTIFITAADAHGNTASATPLVIVPHDQSGL